MIATATQGRKSGPASPSFKSITFVNQSFFTLSWISGFIHNIARSCLRLGVLKKCWTTEFYCTKKLNGCSSPLAAFQRLPHLRVADFANCSFKSKIISKHKKLNLKIPHFIWCPTSPHKNEEIILWCSCCTTIIVCHAFQLVTRTCSFVSSVTQSSTNPTF